MVQWGGAAPASVAQVAGPTGYKNALQITGAASNSYLEVEQRIESANASDLSGQSIAISANIAASSSQTFQWALQYANSADNFGSVTTITTGTWSVTSTSTPFSATVSNLPAGAVNGLRLLLSPNNGAGLTSGTVTITGVQLEKGSTATSFDVRSYGTEVALCQRYFKSYGGNSTLERITLGSSFSTTQSLQTLYLPVQMRVTPSLGYSSLADWVDELPGNTNTAISALTLDGNTSSPNMISLVATYSTNASYGGFKCDSLRATSASARMTFSAEL